jgi:hypothetical protein
MALGCGLKAEGNHAGQLYKHRLSDGGRRWPQLVFQKAVNANLRAEIGSKPWLPS